MKDESKRRISQETANPAEWAAFTRTLEEIRNLPATKSK